MKEPKESENATNSEEQVDEFLREIGANLKDKFKDAGLGETVTAVATVILAIATVVAVVIYGRQLAANINAADAAKSAANTAAAQLEMTDRPWVTIDIVITGPLTYSDKGGVFMSFLFIPENIGRSPAQNVLISPKLIPAFPFDDIRKE